MKKWYEIKGNENDVVFNTRVSLSRNLGDFPFPGRLSVSEKHRVNNEVKDIVLRNNKLSLSFIEMSSLTSAQSVSLAERYIISPEFASNSSGRALLLSEDESVSIMLCEEDHIKIQAVSSGLDLEKTYEIADSLDSIIDEGAGYAFDKNLGYLTQSPTVLGTGMRASVMLYLPALSATGNMNRLSQTVSKLGLTLKSGYTNVMFSAGYIYQLSNQVTLGISEKNAISNLNSIALQLVSQERQARETVVSDDKYIDKIKRAYGILQFAHMISSREFTELASLVRLGASCSLIDADIQKIDELMFDMQPATINASLERNLTQNERDKYRADKIREKLLS